MLCVAKRDITGEDFDDFFKVEIRKSEDSHQLPFYFFKWGFRYE